MWRDDDGAKVHCLLDGNLVADLGGLPRTRYLPVRRETDY